MNFFAEIGVENFPASLLNESLSNLKEIFSLNIEGKLNFDLLNTFGTNRRIGIFVNNISLSTDRYIIGPAYDAFYIDREITELGRRFLSAKGLKEEDIFNVKKDNKEYVAFNANISIDELLISALKKSILELKFPKSMIWNGISFIRPIRNLTAFLDDKCLQFELGEIKSSNLVFVNRRRFNIDNIDQYFSLLKKEGVILDFKEREKVLEGIEIERKETYRVALNSVENPKAVLLKIDDAMLQLPEEVVKLTIEKHQLAIPTSNRKNFYLICDKDAEESKAIKGNLKVIRSRLEDALFFYEDDKKHSLDFFNEQLKGVIFQKGLASMFEKKERLKGLVEFFGKDNIDLIRAADICKADLVTSLVKEKEYALLRGNIGGHYASINNESKEVVDIVSDHYLPRFSGDNISKNINAAYLSIADRADTITGLAILNKLPSGAKDPFYVRREGISILMLIETFKMTFKLSDLFRYSFEMYRKYNASELEKILGQSTKKYRENKNIFEDKNILENKNSCNENSWNENSVLSSIEKFMSSRVENFLQDRFEKRVVNACEDYDNLLETIKKSEAISQVSNSSILNMIKRIVNITKNMNEFKNDRNKLESSLLVNTNLFIEEEERILYKKIELIDENSNNYSNILNDLIALESSLEAFFINVIVQHDREEVRKNREALLYSILRKMRKVGNLEKLLS